MMPPSRCRDTEPEKLAETGIPELQGEGRASRICYWSHGEGARAAIRFVLKPGTTDVAVYGQIPAGPGKRMCRMRAERPGTR